MKRIAVSITESEKEISPAINYCEYYYLVDYKDKKIVSINKVRNPYKNENEILKLVQFIKDQKTNVLITGNLEESSLKMLNKANIKVITDLGETFDVVKNYISNN
ncbi:MAG: NifB/NifX family molybdenum-iron cluster-binding protein [Cyanobacteriota bacterium]